MNQYLQTASADRNLVQCFIGPIPIWFVHRFWPLVTNRSVYENTNKMAYFTFSFYFLGLIFVLKWSLDQIKKRYNFLTVWPILNKLGQIKPQHIPFLWIVITFSQSLVVSGGHFMNVRPIHVGQQWPFYMTFFVLHLTCFSSTCTCTFGCL